MQWLLGRYWFLTSTTYGTWLPGDARGFVSPVPEVSGPSKRHNLPGTAYDHDLPGFVSAARAALKGPPVRFTLEQAQSLLAQFQETAAYRRWTLLAVSIMANHVHIIVGVPEDPDPSDILGDFKSYGSRRMNKLWGKPASETWWTESGSKRILASETSILEAIDYVLNRQEYPLVIWALDPSWITQS